MFFIAEATGPRTSESEVAQSMLVLITRLSEAGILYLKLASIVQDFFVKEGPPRLAVRPGADGWLHSQSARASSGLGQVTLNSSRYASGSSGIPWVATLVAC